MSDRAAVRHSRYCMLLAREVGSLINARAATRAVAAVPACCIPVTNICFVSNRWRCCQYILATRMACFVHTVLLSAEKWSSGPVSLPAWSSYNANGRWRRIKLAWYCWCNKKNEKGAVAILAGVQRNCSGSLAYQLLNSRSSAAMRIYWFRRGKCGFILRQRTRS
jgi:hypothetical protein